MEYFYFIFYTNRMLLDRENSEIYTAEELGLPN